MDFEDSNSIVLAASLPVHETTQNWRQNVVQPLEGGRTEALEGARMGSRVLPMPI